ncbi:Urease accessory protein UreD [Beijerinckiaceae bacterium RH AL1]|nr:Urease accessory protein UreD [Beijerinckiaceae bacterium RH CH11]VVB48480.1 Urease accessory protein UreD [Beijerinckiaceae bacterium RH AL8]VVC56375.1 Urease accessory protein UreD [Beijerinckiaceae bacterium RH AL1]
MTAAPPPIAPTTSSAIRAAFASLDGTTALTRLHESGGLRLRRVRGPRCETILVNTAGGIVGGDRLAVALDLAASADVTVTSVAAEKIYRSPEAPAHISTALTLAPGARLAWLPQETILFDGARLARRIDIDLAADARLVAAEMLVLGRLARGETAISGALRDDWRVRRDGRLVFAEATRLEGAIGAVLDRPALGGGARATMLMLVAAPGCEALVEPLRAAFAPHADVEAGVSARNGIVVARALARSPERLRAAMVAVLARAGVDPLPRVWS